MIRHIVLFTIRNQEQMDFIIDQLRRLGTIPGVHDFGVARCLRVDRIGSNVDIAVWGDFASLEALEDYKLHPTYAEVTSRVRPLRDLRFVADLIMPSLAERRA